MNAFWIIVGALVVLVVTALVPFACRRRTATPVAKNARALYDIRLTELHHDADEGLISAVDRERAEQEITRSLLQETDAENVELAPPRFVQPLLTSSLLAILVPAIAVAVYLQLGNPNLATDSIVASDHETSPDEASIEAMLDGLKARLTEDPESAEAWLLLGRSNMALGRFDEAVPAFRRALQLLGDVPQVLVQTADALAMQADGHIGPEVRGLLQRALVKEPNNIAALWLSGLGAAEAGEKDASLKYFKQAREVSAESGASTAELDAIIRGIDPDYEPPSVPDETAQASISVAVEIEPSLAQKFSENDTVFVFARSPETAGPPLAVTRLSAGSLPQTVVLNESMAMAPMFKLTTGATVSVTARVSKSGEPGAQAGDLQGVSSPFVVGETLGVKLVIDEVVR